MATKRVNFDSLEPLATVDILAYSPRMPSEESERKREERNTHTNKHREKEREDPINLA